VEDQTRVTESVPGVEGHAGEPQPLVNEADIGHGGNCPSWRCPTEERNMSLAIMFQAMEPTRSIMPKAGKLSDESLK